MAEKPTYQELEQRIVVLEKAHCQRRKKIKELKESCFNPALTFQALDNVAFEELFNLENIQRLQDQFANATGVASIITKTDGTPITRPSKLCRLYNDIIRKTGEQHVNYFKSGIIIDSINLDAPTISPSLNNGLWNAGAAILMGEKHIANWLIGQVRDETQTDENIIEYARQTGVDEADMLNAFSQIPVMSGRQFEQITKMLLTLANQLSSSAFHNYESVRFITQQQKTDDALEKSKVYLRTLIHTLPDLIWLKDPTGVYLFCNSRFEMFFSTKAKDIIGKTDYDFVEKEIADIFRQNDKKAIAQGGPSKNEEKVRLTPDGEMEIFETIKTPIYGDDKELVGVLGVGRNITKLKQTEKERLASINFLKSLDRVNQAVHGTNDLEQMMKDVLDVIISIFKCDRAYMLYPCDPDVPFCEVLMERTTPLYPGAFKLNVPIPMTPPLKKLHRRTLNEQSPVEFYSGREIFPEEEPWKTFKIKSLLAVALYPKVGFPWQFGLQQCTHERIWEGEEKRLFKEVSRRLTDGLNSLLMYRDLQKSEESYKAIWNTVPYPILITKKSDQTILELNRSFTNNYGRTRQEAVGSKLIDLNIVANPSDREQFYDRLSRYGHVESMPVRFHLGDQNEQEALISMRPIHFQGEDCFISVNVDVTKQKQIQRALKESESRFRIIFESAADPIFINDIETGRFLDVNQAGCRFLGYTKEQLVKTSFAQITVLGALDPVVYFKKNEHFQDSLFFESKQRRKDGSIALVEVSGQKMRHQDRTILLSIVRDITQRKQNEEELKRYRENLEKMVEDRTEQLKNAQSELVKQEKLAVLGQLTATVSHELRNPLGVIRSSNFFLQRRLNQRDEKTDKHFKRIEEQVSICDTIVADLLEYTRGRKVSINKADLRPWLMQVVEQMEEQLEIKIILNISPNLPALPHDQDKMRRVVINLLTNAAQAVIARKKHETAETFNPQITLGAACKEDNVVISVSDNGIGMDQETSERAFEPLFTTRARGTGIGLAIVKKVVEEHHGTVAVESKLGEGTRISLFLSLD